MATVLLIFNTSVSNKRFWENDTKSELVCLAYAMSLANVRYLRIGTYSGDAKPQSSKWFDIGLGSFSEIIAGQIYEFCNSIVLDGPVVRAKDRILNNLDAADYVFLCEPDAEPGVYVEGLYNIRSLEDISDELYDHKTITNVVNSRSLNAYRILEIVITNYFSVMGRNKILTEAWTLLMENRNLGNPIMTSHFRIANTTGVSGEWIDRIKHECDITREHIDHLQSQNPSTKVLIYDGPDVDVRHFHDIINEIYPSRSDYMAIRSYISHIKPIPYEHVGTRAYLPTNLSIDLMARYILYLLEPIGDFKGSDTTRLLMPALGNLLICMM